VGDGAVERSPIDRSDEPEPSMAGEHPYHRGETLEKLNVFASTPFEAFGEEGQLQVRQVRVKGVRDKRARQARISLKKKYHQTRNQNWAQKSLHGPEVLRGGPANAKKCSNSAKWGELANSARWFRSGAEYFFLS